MTVADIKGRKEVLDAIAEFDRLGRDRFLEKYKFGPSRSYWLVRQGKQYDSKAFRPKGIFGAPFAPALLAVV
jgi:hypothetical protein